MPTLHASHRWQWRVTVAGIALLAPIVAVGVFLAVRWPFTEGRVLNSIRESWPGSVQQPGSFRSTVFPRPGCEMENVVLELPSNSSSEPARAIFRKVHIQASYADLLLRPGHVARLAIDGLRVEIPVYAHTSAPTGGGSTQSGTSGNKPSTTTFGEVETRDAALVIKRSEGRKPLTFAIHRLAMQPVRPKAPIVFDAALTNAEPPGEIHVRGRLGPWQSKQLRDLPLSGSYTFDRADLGVFSGIAGILSSTGTFEGSLGEIKVQGAVDVPAFQVTRSHHEVGLNANFRAVVDGTRGDTKLESVDASFLRTQVHAEGPIASMVGQPGKTASLELSVRNGSIQDVLYLFVKDKTPPMTGAANFRAHVTIPSGEAPFLKKVAVDGNFSISNAALTKPGRQEQIDEMSKRAAGNKKDPQTDAVSGRIEADVQLRQGIAQFNSLSFEIPGATVSMAGKYNLLDERIDFHGHAKTVAELSDQTKGIKAALLKPLNWVFKKGDAGADLPVQMTGTYDVPHFGLDLPAKK